MSEKKTLREIVDFARCYDLGTVEGNAIADWIEMTYLSSPAPIPQQVAQASGIEGLTRYAEHWSGVGMAVDKTGEYVLLSQVERLLATQSAKQSNLQEENRQLRQRIEDLTTAANQCINDAIGQSAQEVTQQAAKAETGSASRDTVDLVTAVMDQFGFLDGVNEHRTEELCQALESALNNFAPTTSTVSASGSADTGSAA